MSYEKQRINESFVYVLWLTYVTIVSRIGRFCADAIHGRDTDVFALFHRAVLKLYPL